MALSPKFLHVTVAPIEHGGLLRKVPTPIVFDEDLSIAAIPAWYRQINLPEFYPQDLHWLQKDAEFGILATFTSPEVITQESASNLEKARDRAYENVMLAQMALWLAGTPLQIQYVSDCGSADGEVWTMTRVTSTDQMLTSPGATMPEVLAAPDVLSATFKTLRALAPECTVRVAINTALKAVGEVDWILRYLCYWLSLEALFGAEDGREISFRLSQRIAFHLRPTGRQLKDTFAKVKEGYGWRSKVVHGVRLNSLTPERSRALMDDIESIVRDGLNTILNDSSLIVTFNGRNQRESYLDGLPFSSDRAEIRS